MIIETKLKTVVIFNMIVPDCTAEGPMGFGISDMLLWQRRMRVLKNLTLPGVLNIQFDFSTNWE